MHNNFLQRNSLLFVNFMSMYFFIYLIKCIMKTLFQSAVITILLTITLSSCYVMSFDVGQGAKLGVSESKKNHFVIFGLVPLSTANVKEMSRGATDYSVTIEHSFLDGLINSFTAGMYTPNTVTIVR